jgi:cyclohexa-1,5-dienecarbonyl-CoA hydratase
MSDSPLNVWLDRNGKLLRLRLARPKANIIDAAMIAALEGALAEHLDNPQLRAVLLDHSGPHFSFGASVEEHLPGQCDEMLRGLHALIRRMVDSPLPILVAVKGQCLGGGLEVAAAGNLIFAAPDAKLGQPEIKLAVFAPAASCLLPARIGQAAAEDLLLSGRSLDAAEAAALGLVSAVAEDPEAAALTYFDSHLAGLSASSLRLATTAARSEFARRVKARLVEVEALYLTTLMETADAVEGLQAFIDRRPPKWGNS